MKNYTRDIVLEFLKAKGINAIKQDHTIKISRDEICAKIKSEGETCYEILLKELSEKIGYRFYYATRSDDSLWLETLCKFISIQRSCMEINSATSAFRPSRCNT